MKKMVNLSVCGRQYYPGQEPEVIELTTEGTMQWIDNGWEISYEESELTGLVGTTTTFRLEDGQVVLIRKGQVRSQMIFREGVPHDSLYQLDFGALLSRFAPSRSRRRSRRQAAPLIWCIAFPSSRAKKVL